MTEITLEEIVPGTFAVLGGICNRGLIASKGNVLVIDSGFNAAEATPLRILADARRVEGGTALLFNTHSHGDHTFGNQVFADLPILAQEEAHHFLFHSGAETLKMWQSMPGIGERIGAVTLTLPTITFREQMTVFVGDIEVQLLFFGSAHSPGDAVAWLPQTRTLFAGDLLFNGRLPVVMAGSNITAWIADLERLEQLGAEHVVPGHGPIQSPAALGSLRRWFVDVRERVAGAVARGDDRAGAMKNVANDMRAASVSYAEEARLPETLGQLFDELKSL